MKKEILQNLHTRKHLCRVSFLIKLHACDYLLKNYYQFIKKETLTQMFSCEF